MIELRAATRWLTALMCTAIILGAGMLVTGCSTDDELVVFAAASLDGHLPLHAAETVSFAGSNALVTQILDGAPVGVLITANRQVAEPVISALDPTVEPLASNSITVAIPASNPGAVTRLSDLGDPDRTIAVCAPEVPCGFATSQLEAPVAADTLEASVRSVLTKVELAEVDAGVVYRTDVAMSDQAIELPLFEDPPTITYLALLLTPDDQRAVEYFEWLTDDGQQALIDAGFGSP